MHLPQTLFARTALILASALTAFLVISALIYGHFVFRPAIKHASETTAAFLILTAQTWSELPPDTRADFENELWYNHQVSLYTMDEPLTDSDATLTKLQSMIATALENRGAVAVHVRDSQQLPGWVEAEFQLGGHIFNMTFNGARLRADIPSMLFLLTVAVGVLTLLATLVIVRHLTRPLALLSTATIDFGKGRMPATLEEKGPLELKHLTRHFNEMTAQLNELMENRTTLLAGISHDLRTPISRLALAIEMLPEHDPEIVAMMRQDLTDMNRLIGDSLALARSQDGQANDQDTLNIPELLDGLLTNYRKDIKTLNWTPGENCWVNTNAMALSRVLENLIENAIRYGNAELDVAVVCGERGGTVEISDHGPGIDAALRQKVFQPFYRIEASRSLDTGGSGLGLAIVEQICKARGWKISLLDRIGGGLTVRLFIPRSPNISKT
ncbi:MAG: ATP-binding protein [Thiotrichales bacterium]